MKTIIHATDYSANSIAALKFAHAMSTQMNAKLLVLHVFDIPTVLSTEVKEPYQHLEKEVFKMHQARLEDLCRIHLGTAYDHKYVQIEAIENTSIVDGIVSKAIEVNAYLVVTGIKGVSALKELMMGNTAKHLIDISPCPVLSIPMGANYHPIKTMVYTTDFEEEDLHAIYKLIEMARLFDAEITIVHFPVEKSKEIVSEMNTLNVKIRTMVDYPKIHVELVPTDDVFSTLKGYLVDKEADVVAMMERKNVGIFKKIFHRDLVKKMESYGQIPLLSFNQINRKLFNV
ncbi:universal stress protein [Flavobacteriaceae bacterium F08102]|nr:universal stress protein [Flavobacteriaceae bacterium F08102]